MAIEPYFKKYTLLNPTDSVTSDGTTIKPKEYAEVQSKQITNPTDPKEGIEMEKSGKEVKLYSDENQAVITSMFINGEEWVKKSNPSDSVTSDEELAWTELGDMLMLRNAVLKKLKAKFTLTRRP